MSENQPSKSKWERLVDAVREECHRRRRDPNVVEADQSQRKISLPLSDGSQFAVKFTETQLDGDLRELAYRFYESYLSEGEDVNVIAKRVVDEATDEKDSEKPAEKERDPS